jgi:hypothetical protein
VKRLHEAISAVAPILGLSVGTPGDSATVRIDFAPEATQAQRDAALVALLAFDWSAAAHQAWVADQVPERRDLRNAAAQAIADNQTYLAIGTPSNAQVVAQVRRLTTQQNAIIRRIIQID